MAKKNLIVGMLVSLGWYDVEPFMVSLKRHVGACDLMFEVFDEMSEWTLNRIASESTDSVKITIRRVPAAFKNKYGSYARFQMIDDYISEHAGEYNQVFMSDVRDVIFQSDPFKPYAHHKSYLAYETEYSRIGDESLNSFWVQRTWGADAWNQIKDKMIICAGTLIGTADAMQIAMRELNKYLVNDNYDFLGADQATLNYLVHTGRMPVKNMFASTIEDGVICTIALREMPIQGDKILSMNGKNIPAVVHQYDRHEKLTRFVDRLYRKNEVRVDKPYTDLKSRLDIANAVLNCGGHNAALNLMLEMLDSNTPEWLTESERVMRMFESFLSKPPISFSSFLIAITLRQMLVQLIQRQAFTNVRQKFIRLMYHMTRFIRQQSEAGVKQFDTFLGDMIIELAKMKDQQDDRQAVADWLEMRKHLDYPLDSEYWLLSAKNNRLLGNKEQAVEDYKKAVL